MFSAGTPAISLPEPGEQRILRMVFKNQTITLENHDATHEIYLNF
jgi:hypothetical protein